MKWSSKDYAWFAPNAKRKSRPIAYSTVATNGLIQSVAKTGATFQQIKDQLFNFSEACAVLDEYIKRGYGDTIARDIIDMEE